MQFQCFSRVDRPSQHGETFTSRYLDVPICCESCCQFSRAWHLYWQSYASTTNASPCRLASKKKTAKSKKWRQWRPSNLVFPREGSAAHFTRALRCNRVYGYQKGSQADFKDGAALYLAGESKFVARNFFFPDPCPFSASFTNQHANSKWGHVKRLV